MGLHAQLDAIMIDTLANSLSLTSHPPHVARFSL